MLTDAEIREVAEISMSQTPDYDPVADAELTGWVAEDLKKFEAAFEAAGYQLVKK
jgi:hypothetical protein